MGEKTGELCRTVRSRQSDSESSAPPQRHPGVGEVMFTSAENIRLQGEITVGRRRRLSHTREEWAEGRWGPRRSFPTQGQARKRESGFVAMRRHIIVGLRAVHIGRKNQVAGRSTRARSPRKILHHQRRTRARSPRYMRWRCGARRWSTMLDPNTFSPAGVAQIPLRWRTGRFVAQISPGKNSAAARIVVPRNRSDPRCCSG